MTPGAPGIGMRLRAAKEAFTPEFGSPMAKLVWALRAMLAFFFIYSLWLNIQPAETNLPLLLSYPLWGFAISIAFAFVPTRRPRTLKLAEAATLGALLLHVAGHAMGWYDAFVWYDKSLHFLNPLASVLIIFALSQATDWIWDWRRVSPIEVMIYTFSMGVAIGVFWEIIEFGMDSLAGTDEQGGNTDTMIDLMLDVGGALLGALSVGTATWYGRKHGADEVSEEPKRRVPRRAPERGGAE